MKTRITLTAVCLALFANMFCQDVVYTIDKQQIIGHVEEIGSDMITYTREDTPGVKRKIGIEDVWKIVYSNGTQEVFNEVVQDAVNENQVQEELNSAELKMHNDSGQDDVSQDERIDIKKKRVITRYYQNGREIKNLSQLQFVVQKNEDAAKLVKQAKGSISVGWVLYGLSFVDIGLMVACFPKLGKRVVLSVAGERKFKFTDLIPVLATFSTSIIIDNVSLSLLKKGYRKADEAIDVWNAGVDSKVRATNQLSLRVGPTMNGVGAVLTW
ncbi:MAG: hypothetical protein IJ680_08060 [Paludibacteraceae bacterium]|nr:hypothetical protein [Paludibacteraceae bacterium]